MNDKKNQNRTAVVKGQISNSTTRNTTCNLKAAHGANLKDGLQKHQLQGLLVGLITAVSSALLSKSWLHLGLFALLPSHIQSIAKSCRFFLNNISESLSVAPAKSLVHALVASRLDYCNLLSGFLLSTH